MIKRSILFLCLICLICSGSVYSQNDPDSISGEQKLMKKKNSTKFPAIYISLSYIGWQGLPSNVKFQPNNNREVSVFKMFNMIKNSKHLNIALGLSASFINMHNNVNKWQFDTAGKVKSPEVMPDTFDKHKLTAAYIYIPLELKYRFGKGGKKLPYIIGIGGKIGTLLFASERTKDGDIKIRERVREGISKINYGTYAFFGYKFVGIIAGYNFSPMFDADHSPSVTNWTAGLSLMF